MAGDAFADRDLAELSTSVCSRGSGRLIARQSGLFSPGDSVGTFFVAWTWVARVPPSKWKWTARRDFTEGRKGEGTLSCEGLRKGS